MNVKSALCATHLEMEDTGVRTGLGLGIWPEHSPRVGIVPDSRHIKHFGLYRAIFLSQRKVIRRCAHPMAVTHSGSGDKCQRLDFSGYFRKLPPPKTWHPVSLYRSSNARITEDILRACINYTIVGAGYKWIGF